MARDRGEDKQQRNACQIWTRAAALKLWVAIGESMSGCLHPCDNPITLN